METTQPHDVSSTRSASMGRLAAGLLFVLPSLLCCISQLVLPTLNTFRMSFQKVSLLGADPEPIGLENYAGLFGNENFWRAAGFTFTTLLVRLFVVAFIPLVLAWAVGRFGRSLRLGLRSVFTLPVVLFTPVAIAITWLMLLNPVRGPFPFEGSWLASAASARSTLLFVDGLYLFGLASGLGLMIYLPLWRRPADSPPLSFQDVWRPTLATWGVGILGVIVWTLSTFTLNFVMTNGGPAGSTSTLGILFYQLAFRNFSMGPAASIASLILLVTLVLGLLAGFVIVVSRLRLDLVHGETALEKAAPKEGRGAAGVVFIVLALSTLGVCLFSVLPFGWLLTQALGSDGLGALLDQVPAGQVLINTFVPPLVTASVQVLIAYLGALGIGALRPFGKRSAWLLLLFSPWLFINVLPLSLVQFLADQKAGTLDTFLGSVSPILLSVPALFILTLFFTGRASQPPRETTAGTSQAAPNFWTHFILPSLPLAVVVWLVIFFFHIQDVFWPLLVSVSPERYTLNVTLLRLFGMFGGAEAMLAAAVAFLVLPVSVFFFLCLVPFQLFYLDRLTLYAEDPAAGEATQMPQQL